MYCNTCHPFSKKSFNSLLNYLRFNENKSHNFPLCIIFIFIYSLITYTGFFCPFFDDYNMKYFTDIIYNTFTIYFPFLIILFPLSYEKNSCTSFIWFLIAFTPVFGKFLCTHHIFATL